MGQVCSKCFKTNEKTDNIYEPLNQQPAPEKITNDTVKKTEMPNTTNLNSRYSSKINDIQKNNAENLKDQKNQNLDQASPKNDINSTNKSQGVVEEPSDMTKRKDVKSDVSDDKKGDLILDEEDSLAYWNSIPGENLNFEDNLNKENEKLNQNLREPDLSLDDNLSGKDLEIGTEDVSPIIINIAKYVKKIADTHKISKEMRENTIVIDTGSYMIKSGFSKDIGQSPKQFRSVTGKNKYNDLDQEVYIGENAVSKRVLLNLSYSIGANGVEDWDGIEKLWDHTFKRQLRIDERQMQESPVLLTLPQLKRYQYEQLCQYFFDYHETPAFFVCPPSVLALYSYGLTTGMVFDSGYHETLQVPVFEGYSLKNCIERVPIAGSTINTYFADTLQDTYNLNTHTWVYNDDILTEIKNKFFYTAIDLEIELANFKNKDKVYYELPDGTEISIGSEIIKCPEIMFQPKEIGMKFGVHVQLKNSIQNCEVELRRELYNNICLSGGNSMIKNQSQRLSNELENLVDYKVNIYDNKEMNGQDRSWVGGALLSNLTSFQDMWVTNSEYQENGVRALRQHCFM